MTTAIILDSAIASFIDSSVQDGWVAEGHQIVLTEKTVDRDPAQWTQPTVYIRPLQDSADLRLVRVDLDGMCDRVRTIWVSSIRPECLQSEIVREVKELFAEKHKHQLVLDEFHELKEFDGGRVKFCGSFVCQASALDERQLRVGAAIGLNRFLKTLKDQMEVLNEMEPTDSLLAKRSLLQGIMNDLERRADRAF